MLSFNNVSVDIAGATVLRNISINLQAGTVYAVVGRNGAGKTTLLRTVMGLVPTIGGDVALDGNSLLSQHAHARAALGIGYAPEDRVMFPSMTVMQNLRLPCEAINMPTNEIDRRLKVVLEVMPQITDLVPRSGAALSGGQGKMAALARALMVGDRVLLVDEPFQGLAPTIARQFAEALQKTVQLRPKLCVVITESNASLLDRIECSTLMLERGALTESPH